MKATPHPVDQDIPAHLWPLLRLAAVVTDIAGGGGALTAAYQADDGDEPQRGSPISRCHDRDCSTTNRQTDQGDV